ncbi:hypothetical protein EVAR_101716_1 [Eumeta japonica]|uniref:Uncharacterized protein n=1 Tax=Eumeta variegata TaxID=151549 RepID=A0A4C1T284_EUMVA|nr:hypothetical protein EVAR_101716_1 [Eumeta japonica]
MFACFSVLLIIMSGDCLSVKLLFESYPCLKSVSYGLLAPGVIHTGKTLTTVVDEPIRLQHGDVVLLPINILFCEVTGGGKPACLRRCLLVSFEPLNGCTASSSGMLEVQRLELTEPLGFGSIMIQDSYDNKLQPWH